MLRHSKAATVTDKTKTPTLSKPATLAEQFDEIREIFRQENAEFRETCRQARTNDFVTVLDELADGHKRSE